MNKYDPQEKCPKCGNDPWGGLEVTYVAGVKVDTMLVTCKKCGWNADRAPLDAEDGPSPKLIRALTKGGGA